MKRLARLPLLLTLSAVPAQSETIAVFPLGDDGRPFVDVYASGLYSATCVDGAGCTCAALPVDRAELAVVLGLASVSADTQGISDVTGMSEMGACNWSVEQHVTWVGK